jgi:acetate kinase
MRPGTGSYTAARRILSGPRRPSVRRKLAALTDLAPLHQPPALEALDAVSALMPGVPDVACFDTAFHAAIPGSAAAFALPADWREK